MASNIEGILAPVFTPMYEDGEVNYSVIADYLSFLKRKNINGILVGGTTGEAASLSLQERKDVLNAWLQSARRHKIKVIAQIGGMPLPDVIEMAQFAEDVEVDAIMTLPELYYKPRNVEQLVSYLETVSKAAPTLPLIYYHFPMMSGVDLNMKRFFALASSRIPNFMGMKADLNVAVKVADLLAPDQKIFMANHHLAEAALMGHESSIATVTNMFPELVQTIVNAVSTGDVNTARKLQETLNRAVDNITEQGEFLPCMKSAMPMITGIQVGPPRRPLFAVDETTKKNIEDRLKAINIIS
ncbi:N-acetylneuraminate lyase-like [Bombyx mandarina]|uniref:N-acetylneuraminate lyase n=1 Tax=Bombyx mandarina TaxID=7092 RepID=A0A6J2JQS1_BOMMA|nr:N-acetylneuraminate lyase-like [Bombyx mandarina]